MEHDVPMVACCPDAADSRHQHGSEEPSTSHQATSACDPIEEAALPATSFDLPDPILIIAETLSLTSTTGSDQRAPTPHFQPLAHGPPLYLATLRIRI